MVKITSSLWMKSWDKHVKKDLDYPKENLGTLYIKAMERFPEKVACWMREREITYKELTDYVKRFATFLKDNSVKKGDVVSICLANSPQFLIAHFGTILAGAVASGLNPLLSEKEIAYQLNDSKSKVIVTLDVIFEKRLTKILDRTPNLEIIVTTNISEYMGLSKLKVMLGKLLGKIPKGKVFPVEGKKVVPFANVMEDTSIDVKPVDIDIEKDLALLQYTGGTTGFPKGTELTHANIIFQHVQFADWLNLDMGVDVVISAFPAFHIAGMITATEAVWLSCAQVLIPNPRDTDFLIDEFIDKKPTIVANVPTLYGMIMNNPKSFEIPQTVLDNVKVYISGAAPFPAEMIRKFEIHMKAEGRVMELYGMTETSPICVSNPFLGKKKIGSVGLPLQGMQVRIVNIENNEDAETGIPGEILLKGPIVTRGYYNKPEATKQTITEGWLHTGDVGVMDEEGYLRIVDRVKDMLIVSGYKVYSTYVESILTKHPSIDLIAIVGVPDPDRPGSEIVKAFVSLGADMTPTEEVKADIIKFADDNLSKYENPKQWEFRDQLPLTTVGKVLKRALKDKD